MNDEPLELLPFGQTAEDHAKAQRNKASAKRSLHLALAWLVLFAFVLAYLAGFAQGKAG